MPPNKVVRVLLLLAALIPSIGAAETLIEESHRMERKWHDAGVVAYKFHPYGEYNLLGSTPPVEVTVRNGRVERIVIIAALSGHREGEHISLRTLRKFHAVPVLTVEDFFALIREYADPAAPAGTIKYDPELGYPIRVFFDNPDVDDDDVLVVFEDFRVTEMKPDKSLERTRAR